MHAYLVEFMQRLSRHFSSDMRVYLMRTPYFNASMAPNGMMTVWSGLLLRVNDEAQLAAILGHEMGHYMQRHTLARMRDMRSKARSEEHTSELQSLMRSSYAVFCLKKNTNTYPLPTVI